MAINFKQALQNLQKYFTPESNGGKNFWSTPIATGLTKAQNFVESVPRTPATGKLGRIDTSLDVNLPIFGKQDLGGAAYNLPAFLLEEIGNAYPRVIWGSKTATQGAKEKDFNKVLLGGATAGEGLFDIATIGIGKSAVKEGIEQVTKRSFKELLGEAMQVGGKQLTKNFVKSEGFKQGLGQGSLIGIENAIDSNKDADIYSILRSSLGTAAMGGIFGGVAEGALKYGSEGLTRGISDTVSYLKRPEIQTALKSQEGAIDTDLLTGGIDRILSGNSKALDPHDLKPSDIGKKLPRETAERMLRNNTPENVEALQKTYAQLSRSTLYDTFQPEKAGEALKYYVDTLGGKTVNQIRKEVFGKEVMSGKKVKIFWDTLAERSGKTINEILDEQTVKAAANELGETTTSQISKEIDAAIPESTKAVQETPQIQEILAKQETKKGVYQALRGVLDTLPAKDEVRSVEQAAKAYTAGTTAIRTSGEELSVRLKKAGLNEADIVDMIEGKTPITKEAAPYVQELQNILADLLPFTEDSSIGDIGRQYWPRMNKGYTQNVDKLMDQLFPNVWVNKLTTMGGNFMERKGVEFEYSKDIAKTLNDYGEQVLYRKYRKDFQPSTEAVEAVVKHVEELGDDFYNYVEKLGPEKKVKEITWGSRILGGALRTYDSVFTRIKKEAPEVFESYRAIRDNNANRLTWTKDISKLLESGDITKVFEYIAKDVYGLSGETADKFVRQQVALAPTEDAAIFAASRFLYQTKKLAVQDFINTTSQFSYKDGSTRNIINRFIDRELKTEYLQAGLLESFANSLLNVFYDAHLGLNVKVAALQGLETTRAAALYGPKNTILSILETLPGIGQKIDDNLDFTGKKPYYFVNSLDEGVGEATNKSLKDSIRGKLHYMTQKSEDWKNQVFTRAAKREAESLGLKGLELQNYVRDNVNRYALIADKFNTPLLMMGNKKVGASLPGGGIKTGTVFRLGMQYGQFALKNTQLIADKVQDKELAQAGALALQTVFNVATIAYLFNTGTQGLKSIFEGFVPIGFGPIFQIPFDIIELVEAKQKAEEEGYDSNVIDIKLKKLLIGSFMPAGTQFNKTAQTIDMMLSGYNATPTDNVAFPSPDNLPTSIYTLLFGPYTAGYGRDYDPNDALSENKSNLYRQKYETQGPDAARQYYKDVQENNAKDKDVKKGIKDLLKSNVKDANIYKQEDGSYVVPVPSGQHKTIEQLLTEDKAGQDTMTDIRAIMNRSGSYEDVPNSPEETQALLQMMGYTQDDYNKWLATDTVGKLKGKERADAVAQLLNDRGMSFTELYKIDVLTKTTLDDLQRYGYIQDADALWESIQMTDPYYAKEALNKINKKKAEKILTLQANTQKKLLNLETKRKKDVLEMLADVEKQRRDARLKQQMAAYEQANIPASLKRSSLPKVRTSFKSSVKTSL